MKRTASLPTRQVRYLAHKALKALGFVNLGLISKAPDSSPVPLAGTSGLHEPADTGLPGAAAPAEQGSAHHLQIAPDDWDCLFRSVQSRLSKAAGDSLTSSSSPPADDAAGQLAALVLECVAALELLRKAR